MAHEPNHPHDDFGTGWWEEDVDGLGPPPTAEETLRGQLAVALDLINELLNPAMLSQPHHDYSAIDLNVLDEPTYPAALADKAELFLKRFRQ